MWWFSAFTMVMVYHLFEQQKKSILEYKKILDSVTLFIKFNGIIFSLITELSECDICILTTIASLLSIVSNPNTEECVITSC